MDKEFWVLGLTKSGDRVEVGVFSSEHVLPKGVVLQPLVLLPSQEHAERVRKHFGDARLCELWGDLFHIVVDQETGKPSIVSLQLGE